jgi:NIMA (never in mitosis gene a)-related kinase
MSLSDFHIIDRLGNIFHSIISFLNFKLGEGSYSSVYKVKRKSDDKIYALKKVKMVELNEKERQNALNEVRILASIKHQNIISYKEAFFDDATSCLW